MAENKTEFLITARDLTKEAFASVNSGLGKIGSALGSVQSAIIGAVGIGGMGALIKSSMDTSDALAKASDRLGITTEALAGLHYAGDLAGVSADSLNTGLGKMSKTLAEAAGGSKQADEAFRALGLSSQQLSQMPADQAFMRISDALMNVDNNMQRLNLTQDIFGKGSTDIINLMAEGSEGMAAATREAKALGLALSRVDAAKIEIANDQFTRIKGVFAGIGNTIAVQLSPYIQAVGDWLVKSSVEADGFRSHIQIAMESAAKAVGFLADMFRGLHVVWKLLEQGWYELQNVIIQGIAKLNAGLASMASLLPGIEIKPNSNLQQWAADSSAGIEKTRAELEALAMAQMPSAGIEEFFAKIKQINAEAATAMAAKGSSMAGTGGIDQAPGIGDKEAEQTAKYMAELQKQLQALYDSTAPKIEVLGMEQAQKQALLDEGFYNGLTSEQLYYEQSAALHQQYQDKLTAAALQGASVRDQKDAAAQAANNKMWASGQTGKLEVLGGVLGGMANLMQSSNKKQFEIGKKAAMGEALIATYTSAVSAFKALAGIPYVGPVLGAVAAAAAIGFGLSNVARIRSQKFGGGGAGGGSVPTFNASPNTGLPDASESSPVAPSLPQSAQVSSQPRNVNVTIESVSGMMSAEYVRDVLIPSINDAVGDGVNLRTTMA